MLTLIDVCPAYACKRQTTKDASQGRLQVTQVFGGLSGNFVQRVVASAQPRADYAIWMRLSSGTNALI